MNVKPPKTGVTVKEAPLGRRTCEVTMFRVGVASGGVVVEGFAGPVLVSVGGKYSLVYRKLVSAEVCVHIVSNRSR